MTDRHHNFYKPIKAKLEKIIDESPTIKTFVLIPETAFSFDTGQFIEVTIDNVGEAPYTPSSSPYIKDKLEVTIMEAGYVTGKMHNLKKGEILGIRGPFGRGYPLDEFYNKEVVILGGGVGLAPLRCLLYALIEEKEKFKRIILCYGAKTPEDIIFKDLFSELKKIDKLEVYRSVDKADETWTEKECLVTFVLDDVDIDIKNSVAVVCGPPIMMRCSTEKLLSLGYAEESIYLSMEKNMSCGVGKCGHCQMGDYFVCKDGPVFKYSEIKDYPGIWK